MAATVTHSTQPDSLRSRRWYYSNHEQAKARGRERARRWRAANPEKARASGRRYVDSHREERRATQRAGYHAHADARRASKRAWWRRTRLEVLAAYGGHCACCEEYRTDFLTLDHVNGGGAAERRRLGTIGPYRRAKLEGFPPIYRVLCANCNQALTFAGRCPHEES